MYRPLQPSFKIRIFDGNLAAIDTLKAPIARGEDFIDIESCCSYPVTYEESADMLTHLNFTVDKYADILLYYFHIGQTIILYGGFYADNESGMRHVFTGTVTRIRTRFSDSGRVSFSVECMNYGFTKMGKDYKNFVYPDISSSRKFAQNETISVEQIIRGIAKENNFEIGEISMQSGASKVNFDKVNVRYQKNMTDWQFLTKLAQDFGCSVWISSEDGTDKLYFVSHETAFAKQSVDIQFVYPLNGRLENLEKGEWQEFDDPSYNRPRILREVTVDEDIANADSITRSAMYYDRDTGEYKEAVSRIETDKDGNKSTVFYELDEAKVEEVNREDPELADHIRENSPASLKWGTPDNPRCASYYYKAIRRYESSDEQAIFDMAFFGLTLCAKCNQDLNIRSQRTYQVRGILSYRTKSQKSSYFLRSLKHIWDADGNWTELEFMR